MSHTHHKVTSNVYLFAMADESKSCGNGGSEVKLNFIEIILSDLCIALMETRESEKHLISRLKSISPEAKKEYLNIKREFITKPTKAQSCHHLYSPSVSMRKSMVSRLLLLGKKIMSDCSNGSDSVNDFKVIEYVIRNILEALMDTHSGQTSFQRCLQGFCKSGYLDLEGATNTKTAKVPTDQNDDHGTAKALPQKSPTRAESAFSIIVDHLFLPREDTEAQFINSSENSIKVVDLVKSFILDGLMNKQLGEECFMPMLNVVVKFISICGKRINFVDLVHSVAWDDLMNKRQGEERFMPRKSIVAEIINSRGNNINVADLVYGFIWHELMETPQGEELFLSRLQRIRREAIKEYLNLTTVLTSETEVNTQDCEPKASRQNTQKASTQAASESASSTAKKSKKPKATFSNICESLIPRPVLPGGLVVARSIYCAKVALSFYNCKHGTDYKLIEPLASAQYTVCGILFHSNFIAAKLDKNGQCTARPKLFYADFLCFRERVRDVHCCIINFKKATFACCGECPPVLAHCEKRSTNGISVYSRTYSPKESKARKNEFCAKAALNFFNEKHGTKYGLVESLDSFIAPINLGTYRFGCRFKAKLEEPSADDDFSPKLFMAELVMSSGWKDGYCSIINTAEDLDDDQATGDNSD